jgi:hypothetical protein
MNHNYIATRPIIYSYAPPTDPYFHTQACRNTSNLPYKTTTATRPYLQSNTIQSERKHGPTVDLACSINAYVPSKYPQHPDKKNYEVCKKI